MMKRKFLIYASTATAVSFLAALWAVKPLTKATRFKSYRA